MITKPQRRQPDQTHLKLLQMSGDVHPNSGPATKYPCPVCTRNVTSRHKCTKCYGWVHAKCSGILNACSALQSQQSPPPTRSPAPPTKQISDDSTFNVLQLNANGIGNKLTELEVVLERNKVKVAVIQESKLLPKSKNPCIQNYTTVRKDRSHGQRGTKLIISNVYIPPVSSCRNGYHSSIEHLTTPDTLIIGGFNAHHPSWYSRSTDTRGRKMADSINGSDYGILNWDSPTRVPPNAEPSSPDVSLASASVITSCSWQTLSTLSSDHLPILIRLQMKTPSDPGLRRTYVNLKMPTGLYIDMK